jgi:hypothetical protein
MFLNHADICMGSNCSKQIIYICLFVGTSIAIEGVNILHEEVIIIS